MANFTGPTYREHCIGHDTIKETAHFLELSVR
jgi:hypothetical protein